MFDQNYIKVKKIYGNKQIYYENVFHKETNDTYLISRMLALCCMNLVKLEIFLLSKKVGIQFGKEGVANIRDEE